MIVLVSDHAGFSLKEEIKKFLEKSKTEYIDCGAKTFDKDDDYPDYCAMGVKEVLKNEDNAGIFICGSGIGMSMCANRYKGIRAVLANDLPTAFLSRKDNDANVLCMGGRMVSKRMAIKIIKVFFSSEFEGGRHIKRLQKFN